jgi:hypothetical protein
MKTRRVLCFSLCAGLGAAFACSAPPSSPPEAVGTQAAALSVGSGGNDGPIGHPPPAPTAQKCQVNPLCGSEPTTGSGFDPVFFGFAIASDSGPGGLAATDEGALADALENANCAPERSYTTASLGYGYSWVISICPTHVSIPAVDADQATILPCDSCTGTPTTHGEVIAWLKGSPLCNADGCWLPGKGCNEASCLVASQAADIASGGGTDDDAGDNASALQ